MILDHTDDAATNFQKLVAATNAVIKLTEQLALIGGELNTTKIDILKSIDKESLKLNKIAHQVIEGKFSEIKARIKCQKEIINSLKIILKAENIAGGF